LKDDATMFLDEYTNHHNEPAAVLSSGPSRS
jgi:hypothetical protein